MVAIMYAPTKAISNSVSALKQSFLYCSNVLLTDSSFMYVMTVLCMVKLYQNRHPDINANAYSTFGVLAVAILLGINNSSCTMTLGSNTKCF